MYYVDFNSVNHSHRLSEYLRLKATLFPNQMTDQIKIEGITDEQGNVKFELSPGVYHFSVEAEGYEPCDVATQLGDTDRHVTLAMKPITKEYIQRENGKIRSLIRQSVNILEVGELVKKSDHLVKLSTSRLKDYATKQLRSISKVAKKRIEELRTVKSSLSFGVGPYGLSFTKESEKK